ncbi:aryl-alcohol-oxidase from pleurotus Eryingii [Lactarius psammicola]|nr:aryl-alcohol-oxidase from pleurotus Eryingii [Lactarius psammicola]
MRLFVIAALFLKPVFAAVYADPSTLPNASYTYIIVGAGPGGSVLANRLSANPNNRVLLIEAGPSDTANPSIPIPFLCPTLAPSIVSWNYTTIPQTGLGGRSIEYPRGRTLGGSTSINYMVWTRGPASDFDRLARDTGDPGWSWSSLRSTLIGVETLVSPPDGHDTTGEVIPAVHGSNGPVKISVQDTTPLDSRIFDTTTQLSEFPFNQDTNSGDPLGVGWGQFSIGSGQRSSASTSYLTPALSRSNLDVLINTQVTKVVQTGTRGGLPIFRGVQFAQSASGKETSGCSYNRLTCRRKARSFPVMLQRRLFSQAGAVNTPQILMLSGIGDSAQLSQFNIQTIVNLPDVGKNLQDHVVLHNVFSVNSNFTNDDIIRNTTLIQNDLAQWEESHTGPFATSVTSEVGWFRLPKNATIFKTVNDPSSGPQAPHYEFIFVGQRQRIVSPAAPAWSDYVIGPFGTLADAKTDSEIEAFARSHASTVFHPTSTASMSRHDCPHGVVNPDLSVKKTVGLRIVDASVLPDGPAAHPQAILYAIAERAAKLIAKDKD